MKNKNRTRSHSNKLLKNVLANVNASSQQIWEAIEAAQIRTKQDRKALRKLYIRLQSPNDLLPLFRKLKLHDSRSFETDDPATPVYIGRAIQKIFERNPDLLSRIAEYTEGFENLVRRTIFYLQRITFVAEGRNDSQDLVVEESGWGTVEQSIKLLSFVPIQSWHCDNTLTILARVGAPGFPTKINNAMHLAAQAIAEREKKGVWTLANQPHNRDTIEDIGATKVSDGARPQNLTADQPTVDRMVEHLDTAIQDLTDMLNRSVLNKENLNRIRTDLSAVKAYIQSATPDADVLKATQEFVQDKVLDLLKPLSRQVVQHAQTQTNSVLHPELKERERQILSQLLHLGNDEVKKGQTVIAALNNIHLSGPLTKSFSSILRTKQWGVVCPTCEKPATLVWRESASVAQFSHSGPKGTSVKHSSAAVFGPFKLCKRPDRRQRGQRNQPQK